MFKRITITLLAMLMLAAMATTALAGKDDNNPGDTTGGVSAVFDEDVTVNANLTVGGTLTLNESYHRIVMNGLDKSLHLSGGDGAAPGGGLIAVRGANATYNTHGIDFWTGGAHNMTLNKDGNLSIGGSVTCGAVTTGTLTVGTNCNAVLDGSNKWVLHTPDDGRKNMYIAPWGDSWWDWGKQVIITGDGTLIVDGGDLSVHGNGTFTGTVTTGSSRELKTNINRLSGEKAVDALMSLVPVEYNYKANSDELELGFIAEDVPELVARNDRKSLSPMDFAALSVTVIQELKKETESQQLQIEELKELVNELLRKK